MASRASETPREILENHKSDFEEEATPKTIFFSISDEAVMPPAPSLADYFCLFQDLTRRVADSLQIPLEKVKDTHCKLLDILIHLPSQKFPSLLMRLS